MASNVNSPRTKINCCFTDSAFGSVKNRNNPVNVNEFKFPKNGTDNYRGIFLFTETLPAYVDKYKTVKGCYFGS